MHVVQLLQILFLMLLANGAPVIAKRIFGPALHSIRLMRICGSTTVDDYLALRKTIRGVICALSVTGIAAPLIGLSIWLGLVIAASAMAGDLLSSFTKRRLGRPASSRAIPIDQIPESLLPLLACYSALGLSVPTSSSEC